MAELAHITTEVVEATTIAFKLDEMVATATDGLTLFVSFGDAAGVVLAPVEAV